MRVVELHGDKWKSILDFNTALGRALYEYDGRAVATPHSVDAQLELLVWDISSGGSAPYTIRVSGISNLSAEVRDRIALLQRLVLEARTEAVDRAGYDVDVSVASAFSCL